MTSYLELLAKDKETGMLYNGLPVIVVDDDFAEYLEEQSYESLEVIELWEEWSAWAKENLE
jgi:hypothetical protein